jgi:hypothetical protein
LEEQERAAGDLHPLFRCVVGVVEPDADDFARLRRSEDIDFALVVGAVAERDRAVVVRAGSLSASRITESDVSHTSEE